LDCLNKLVFVLSKMRKNEIMGKGFWHEQTKIVKYVFDSFKKKSTDALLFLQIIKALGEDLLGKGGGAEVSLSSC